MASNILVQNVKKYYSSSHQFINTGSGPSSLPISNYVTLSKQTVLTIENCNVGIGTTVPLYALDANGDINFTGILRQNGIPYVSSQWTTSGTNLYYSSGNIGIGTNNPTQALYVVGNILATGTLTASNVSVIGDYVTLNTITSNTEQVVVTNAGTGPALKVTQTGAQPIAQFYDDNNVLALTIADGGNVGIGKTNPTYTLDVSGNINFTGSLTSNNIPFLGIGDSIPVGAILPYYSATLSDPSYLICDGATYQRADYIELANALGVNPAAITFTVPDLRDKFLKGRNADAVGATGGSATKTLTEANMPAHSHSGTTTSGEGTHTHTITDPGHTHTVGAAAVISGFFDQVLAQPGTAQYVKTVNAQNNTTGITINSANSAHTHTFTTDTKGSGTAFDILPPYTSIIYVIKAKNNQYATRPGDYWANSNNQLFYQSGNVGIGTNAPQALLDVNGSARISGTFSKDQELIQKEPINLGTAGWYIIGTFSGPAGSRMELKVFGSSGYSTYNFDSGGYTLLTVSINDNTIGFSGNCSGTFSSYGGTPAMTQFKLVQNGADRFSHKIVAYVEILTKHTLHATLSKGSTFVEEFTSTSDPGSTSGTVQSALNVISTVKKFVGIGTTSPNAVLHINTLGVNALQSIVRVDDIGAGTTPFIINDVGSVGIGTASPQAKLHVNGNSAIITSATDTILTVQTTNDANKAEVAILGNNQGTGRVYVGQSTTYGGGIEYNGDNTPATSGAGADYTALYRRDNGVDSWTARNYYNTNDWEFRGRIINANPRFYAYGASGTSGTSGQYWIFPDTNLNVGNHYNTSTGIFTAPIAGTYIFNWGNIGNTTSTVYRYRLHINNAQHRDIHLRIDTTSTSSTDYGDGERSYMINLTAGETVRIYFVSDNGAASYIGADYPYFMGYLIG